MEEAKFRGGARVGMANATWPFATLTISKNNITLKVRMFAMLGVNGLLIFNPEDITSIKPLNGHFFNGVRINHIVKKYEETVVFWTSGDPFEIVRAFNRICDIDRS
ncbi:MAG: hypothetical protein H6607_04705 [Flavobacteriales bacterium]|nr:hypothetical protein [Flavobacteriales bacterium]